jgi:broad specificity phosphatase PhoE
MKKLIIVRHGETVDNVSLRIQGQQPGQLTSEGYRQVELLGLRFRGEKLDKIFSSDLARVRQTTDALIKHHSIDPEFRIELRERAFGEFEGRTIEEYQRFVEKQAVPFYEVKPPGGETILELMERARSFIYFAKMTYPQQNVLFSAHGAINRALILNLLNLDISQWKSLQQDNTCVNSFIFEADGRLGEYDLNCTVHLDSERNAITAHE